MIEHSQEMEDLIVESAESIHHLLIVVVLSILSRHWLCIVKLLILKVTIDLHFLVVGINLECRFCILNSTSSSIDKIVIGILCLASNLSGPAVSLLSLCINNNILIRWLEDL